MNHELAKNIIDILEKAQVNREKLVEFQNALKELIIHASVTVPDDKGERDLVLEDISTTRSAIRLFEKITVAFENDRPTNT